MYSEYDFTGRKLLLKRLREENSALDKMICNFEEKEGGSTIRDTRTLLNWPAIQIGKINSLLTNAIELIEPTEDGYKDLEIASKGFTSLFESIIKKQRESS